MFHIGALSMDTFNKNRFFNVVWNFNLIEWVYGVVRIKTETFELCYISETGCQS